MAKRLVSKKKPVSKKKQAELLKWYLEEWLPWYQRQQDRASGKIAPLATGQEDPPPPPPWVP